MILPRPSRVEISRPGALLERLNQSTVVWSWLYNALRLALAVILLPLVLRKLPTPELGMYYLLMSQVALVPLVDFGFGPTIGRFVSYAMGGAETIQAQGLAQPGRSRAPNYQLVWELLSASRILYRYLTLVLFLVLGTVGTLVVELRAGETASPDLTRLSLGGHSTVHTVRHLLQLLGAFRAEHEPGPGRRAHRAGLVRPATGGYGRPAALRRRAPEHARLARWWARRSDDRGLDPNACSCWPAIHDRQPWMRRRPSPSCGRTVGARACRWWPVI